MDARAPSEEAILGIGCHYRAMGCGIRLSWSDWATGSGKALDICSPYEVLPK